MGWRRSIAVAVMTLACAATADAAVVRHGYLPLPDGTQLGYTLTLPLATGRFPVVLQYDPYYAGATNDPTWNDAGYAMLGVNFRGTGCSQGVFQPLRADVWGADGAQVVDWAARQSWSDGSVGMLGYSFTGTSQLATAAYAGPALKAIMPGNVFPDLYGDLVEPGGILNAWIPLWIGGARQFALGTATVTANVGDLKCDVDQAVQAVTSAAQGADPILHPYRDDAWAHEPDALLDRVRTPALGCVDWQDTTVQSRAFNAFREQLPPATTWLVAGDGAHGNCPISRPRRVRFLDHYLKGVPNGWEREPHLILEHEITASAPPGRDLVPENAAPWRSSFATWRDVDAAIKPLRLHLRTGGRLDLAPPVADEPPDRYAYPLPSASTPGDFAGISTWSNPILPGSRLTYTTARLTHDVEILGSGSADLWIASTGPNTDLQITLSEIRPDGQEQYVQNGWLRVSKRKLDPQRTTALRPVQTFLQSDDAPLAPGTPVLARVELQPVGHVFRAGSALRLTIDTPTTWLRSLDLPATDTILHTPAMASSLVLGQLPGARAQAPAPACGKALNQPCRRVGGGVPAGALDVPEPAVLAPALSIRRVVRRARTLRVTVHANRAVRDVRLVLRDARRNVIAAGSRVRVRGTRTLRLRLPRRLRAGAYVLTATVRGGAGQTLSVKRRVRLR